MKWYRKDWIPTLKTTIDFDKKKFINELNRLTAVHKCKIWELADMIWVSYAMINNISKSGKIRKDKIILFEKIGLVFNFKQ